MDTGFTYWLQAENKADATVKNHMSTARAWYDWCATHSISPQEATRDDMLRWRTDLAKDNAPSTVRLRMLGLRIYYDYLIDVGLRSDNPARLIKLGKQISKPVDVFTDDELVDMIEAAETMRDRAIILLLLGGGLRRDEVHRITREDVDFDKGTIRIFGKGSKYRIVAPGLAAMAALRFALKREMRLCPGAEEDDDFVWRRVRRVAKLAGVQGRVYPHRFRHTFATSFCENGGGVDMLQTLLGHSDIEMSIYYSKSGREKRALNAQVEFNPADRLLKNVLRQAEAAGLRAVT